MLAASAFELLKNFHVVSAENIKILLIGNVVAFFVAMLAIKGFISFLTNHGFRLFGYYRIVIGLVILIMLAMGIDLNMAG